MQQAADQVIVAKIRKLLRLAKTEGPEGENAAARAAELMEKHQLDVKLEDASFRLVCENVSGELWREQLLLAIAISHGCKLMIGTERAGSDKGCAAVVGERKHAEEAVAHYLRMQVGLVMRCQRDWQRFVDTTIPHHSGHLDHIFRMNEIIGVWSRLYLINAAQTVATRMAQAARTSPPSDSTEKSSATSGGSTEDAPEAVPLPATPERVAESRQSDEETTIEREATVLERLMGIERAMQLQHTAWSRGATIGGQVSIVDDGSGAMGEERQLA